MIDLGPSSLPFSRRHIGLSDQQMETMARYLGADSASGFVQNAMPEKIRSKKDLDLPKGMSEFEALSWLKTLSERNRARRCFLGRGFSETVTPPVIQRNLFENPGWYTSYTPYQAEISQGRLESLLNFQTMVCEITGMEVSNASLLDEGTAAAEAMSMAYGLSQKKQSSKSLFVDSRIAPHVLRVIETRAEPLDIQIFCRPLESFSEAGNEFFAAVFCQVGVDGEVQDLTDVLERSRDLGTVSIVTTDLMMLTLVKPPGELGADIVVGSSQRFGVPMGNGGPHAAFLATKDAWKRSVPGRIVGVSVDRNGKRALRLALQTREQHIRREKATSNICTAQVLLANMAAMYAVFHGDEGLKVIAGKINFCTRLFKKLMESKGLSVLNEHFFDSVQIQPQRALKDIQADCYRLNLEVFFDFDSGLVQVAFGETVTNADLADLYEALTGESLNWQSPAAVKALQDARTEGAFGKSLARSGPCLKHPVFSRYRTETELMRYMHQLQSKDLSLVHSMVPLGSCTMKLNSAAELMAVSMEGFSRVHPYAPEETKKGYHELYSHLEAWLSEITGFAGVSLQPNAGSQGEYAGLLVIKKYLSTRPDGKSRDLILIPSSAHGTNPASAVMAGFKVQVVQCDSKGNIDLSDLKAKASENQNRLAALMVTYPSTHGVFEDTILEISQTIHSFGGQVYMDGANLNALVGLCRPAELGVDVAHLNLHKTFAIPHGGGGPGVGPIGVAQHLVPFLPTTTLERPSETGAVGLISASPWGSASILPISFAYIAMMGKEGLIRATEAAILSTNYIVKRLSPYYSVLYTSEKGYVAHECILDIRPFREFGVTVEDVAKRLMDYGYHAPTMSWPVSGTLMVEPTESESLEELDRFCDAMIAIRNEIKKIEEGQWPKDNNPLVNAPHSVGLITEAEWRRPYSREEAFFPFSSQKSYKYWPPVSRVDNVYGDKNLVCSCPPLEDYL